MTTPFVAQSIAGPRCGRCPATEQTCAREYPCCENCDHFTEPERPLDLTPDLPRQEPRMTQPTHLRDIATDLLARARTIQAKPVTAAVERVDQAIERLRSVLLAYDEHAATRRQIEQLEARLVEARAKLRGGGSR